MTRKDLLYYACQADAAGDFAEADNLAMVAELAEEHPEVALLVSKVATAADLSDLLQEAPIHGGGDFGAELESTITKAIEMGSLFSGDEGHQGSIAIEIENQAGEPDLRILAPDQVMGLLDSLGMDPGSFSPEDLVGQRVRVLQNDVVAV